MRSEIINLSQDNTESLSNKCCNFENETEEIIKGNENIEVDRIEKLTVSECDNSSVNSSKFETCSENNDQTKLDLISLDQIMPETLM